MRRLSSTSPERPPLPGGIEGRSLLPHLEGRPGHDEVHAEYLAEGALAPIVMIRKGRYKFIHSPADPDQLYDLSQDPDELVNLADDPSAGDIVVGMRREVRERWDLPALHESVVESQDRRRFIQRALSTGASTSWDFQPVSDASRRYVRSHMDLDDVEAMARFPSANARKREDLSTEPVRPAQAEGVSDDQPIYRKRH